MIRLCIFDLDGTLCDTLASIAYFANTALRALGARELPLSDYRRFIGNGADRLMRRMAQRVFGEYEESLIAKMRKIYDAAYAENPAHLVEPYEGIRPLLAALSEKGVLLAVNSNKPDDMTNAVVQAIFGQVRFARVLGQREGLPQKPDPAAVYEILDALSLSPGECVYIGDSEVDIATAKNAGVASIAATWGFRSREALLEAGAGLLADSPGEILALIENL